MLLKTLTTAFIFILCLTQVKAEDAETIIKQSLEARGDVNAYKNAKSLIISGNQSQMGMSVPFSFYKKQIDKENSKYLMESEGMGAKQALCYNGTSMWVDMGGQLQIVPNEHKEQFLPQVTQLLEFVEGPLMYYEKGAAEYEFSGNVKEDGRDSYTLKMTEDGNERYIYVDKKNNELFKIWMTVPGQNDEPMEITLKYSDYKKVNGFSIAHKMDLIIGEFGTTSFEIEKFLLNPKIDDSLFEVPGETDK